MISSKVPLPLASLLTQIEQALDAKLYYAALAIVFTLPDVCASLEADHTQPYWQNDKKFAAWFDRNVADRFQTIDGGDFYRMRGGVLHRGQFSHKKSKFDRVLFIIPGSPMYGHDITFSIGADVSIGGKTREEVTGNMIGRQPTGDVLLMDVVRFCRTVVEAVCEWSLIKIDDENFQVNIGNLVHYRPEGLPPLMVGFPVIG